MLHFRAAGSHCEMECVVTETRSQSDVVRPLDNIREEDGIKVELVDHSSGGILVESNQELLDTLLMEASPRWADAEDFEGETWQDAVDRLRGPLVHLTLYPRYLFPHSLAEFKPDLPPRISVLARVARTHRKTQPHGILLQHGFRFCYDADSYSLGPEDLSLSANIE